MNFEKYYENEDPWGVKYGFNSRDYFFDKAFKENIEGRKILEIGCGEGNISEIINKYCSSGIGIDLSKTAIKRAKREKISKFTFKVDDLFNYNYNSYDSLIALEVIYYLTKKEREKFFKKFSETQNKILIFSTPIIGENHHRNYFTEPEIIEICRKYNLTIKKTVKLNIYQYSGKNIFEKFIAFFLLFIYSKYFLGILKFNFLYQGLRFIPDKYIFQKLFVIESN
jgi:2-polyprenyl-3-methyl-5-hydroxy-6-metoxy-1,4-benzoquinol methylase